MDSIHTWQLTIAGTERTGLVRPGTLEWTTKEGRELDTLRCILDDRTGVFGSSLAAYSELILTADPGTVNEQIVFGGYIIVATPAGDETGQWLSFEVQASGYEVLFDATPRVRQTWVNTAAGTIATALLTAAGLNAEFDVATYVETGPTIEVFTADGSEALTKTLDRLCTQAEMMWYADAEKNVHLAAEDSASEHSPFDVIAPGTLADHLAGLYEIEAGTLRVKQDASGLVNRLHILGGYALDPVTSDTFAGSDAQEVSIGYAFNLSHQKIRSSVQVFYNDVSQVLGTAFVDYFGKVLASGQTVQVLVSRINGVVYFPLTTVFDPADEIVVSYQVESRQELTLDASNSTASLASYTLFGRYFDGELDAAPVTDAAEMAEAGEAYLEAYALPVLTGAFSTLRLGLRAGQSCAITSARDGLSGRYVLRSVTNELLATGYVRVTAQFGGRREKLGNWVGGGTGGGAGGTGSGGDGGTLPGGGQQGPIQGDAGPLNLVDILTALKPGTVWDPSTGGDATGLVLTPATPSAAGRLLGYLNGVLQTVVDSDGKIKWAGGEGVLDSSGFAFDETKDLYVYIKPGTQQSILIGAKSRAYGIAIEGKPASYGLYVLAAGVAGVYGTGDIYGVYGVTDGNAFCAGVYGIASGAGGTGVKGVATDENGVAIEADGTAAAWALKITGGQVDGGGQIYTSLGDAVSDTDALNRQTGDARYAPIAGAHAAVTLATDAQAILNLSTQEIGLVAQPANRVFAGPASGADADPTVRALVAADLPAATESAQGAVELATVGEAATGTDTSRAVTPAGLPLRVVGSGWALKETDGDAPGGNSRGSGAVDLQSTRGVASQVASGTRSTLSGGYSNTASGTQSTVVGGASNIANAEGATVIGGDSNAAIEAFGTVGGGADNVAAGVDSTVVGGYDNIAEANYATVAGGRQAHARLYGQVAAAAGKFSARGDAQRSDFVLRGATSDGTQTELFLDGASQRLAIQDDTTWFFEIRIAARRTDANGESAAYLLQGCIDRNAGTVALVGAVTKTVLAEDTAAWDVAVTADDTNKALVVQVTGEAGKAIRWVAHVGTVEVMG